MKIGNTLHAVLLGAIALGAVAFLLLRLLPHGRGPVASASEVDAAGSRTISVDGLPTDVLNDAFSHPKLVSHYLAGLSPGQRDTPKTVVKRPKGLDGTLPFPISEIVSNEEDAAASEPDRKPSESAGTARDLDGSQKSKITLNAIMKAREPLAMLTLDDKTEETVRVGDWIDLRYQVKQFSENAVLLVSKDDKTWLYVGHEVIEK